MKANNWGFRSLQPQNFSVLHGTQGSFLCLQEVNERTELVNISKVIIF